MERLREYATVAVVVGITLAVGSLFVFALAELTIAFIQTR